MNEGPQNLAVGITALLALVVLAGTLLLFGQAPRWLSDNYLVTITLPQSAGLGVGSRVRMNGVSVGEVRDVELISPPGQGVRIQATLRSDIRVPRGATLGVETPLIGGSASLILGVESLTEAQRADLLPTDDTATLAGDLVGAGMMDQMQAVLEKPMAKLDRVADSIERLSAEWTAVGANLNRMTEHRNLDDVNSGVAEANLSSVIARIDARIGEVEKILTAVEKLVTDPRISSTLDRTQSAVDELGDAATTFGRSVDQLGTRYVALADELAAAVTSIKSAVDRVDRGEGTLGKLMTDTQLYDNLNDAAERLGLMLDEAKLLIEKWKAEGVPVRF